MVQILRVRGFGRVLWQKSEAEGQRRRIREANLPRNESKANEAVGREGGAWHVTSGGLPYCSVYKCGYKFGISVGCKLVL